MCNLFMQAEFLSISEKYRSISEKYRSISEKYRSISEKYRSISEKYRSKLSVSESFSSDTDYSKMQRMYSSPLQKRMRPP